jgi:hypothetical protein
MRSGRSYDVAGMTSGVDSRQRGPLGHVLATRHGEHEQDPEAPLVIEHREALIYALGKAAELEHLIICQYLFAAFSLKRDTSEGVSMDVLPLLEGWRKGLFEIAEQEMLHLALVQNLLTAVGAGPHFGRPSFPVPPRSFPAKIRIELMPFSEAALRHFAFLERPEGMAIDDAEGFAALDEAKALAGPREDEIGPIVTEFETISHLYRSIQDGLIQLAGRMGEEAVFVGPEHAQATSAHFHLDGLEPVTDLSSAGKAIDTIVEQGEGARGEWRQAHFGRLLGILDEYLAARRADPDFEPSRPVLGASVRPPESGVAVPVITQPFTVRCADLLNAVYEVVLQLLARSFAHADESDEQLAVLANVAITCMEDVIGPLGGLVTRLPVGPEHPGRTAGPMFELFYATDHLLPHRTAAWTLMIERLREVADFAVSCRNECPPGLVLQLSNVSAALRKEADRLAAAAG